MSGYAKITFLIFLATFHKSRRPIGSSKRSLFFTPLICLITTDMLSHNFNEHEQADVKKQWPLNLRVSYTRELTDKLNKALHFVTEKIGFKPPEEFTFVKGLQNLELQGVNGKTLTIELELLETGSIESIVFHTDDCLRDYHKYTVSGVEFANRPEYTASGLQVKFIDEEDNSYILLEERNYSEPI